MAEAYPFTNLTLRAGGVKGIAYAGSIKALEEKDIIKNVQRIAGSSAGSIVAVAISYGYNATQCQQILHKTHFSTFMDGMKNPFRLFKKYGLYRGRVYLEWMKKLVSGKLLPDGPQYGFSENATFKDFKNAGLKDLYVLATDLNTKNIQEFSFDKTPDVSVAEACRASMAIPAFFPAWKFSNNNPNNHIYVDGGVLDIYPINFFDGKRFNDTGNDVNKNTLGLFLSNAKERKPDLKLDYGHFIHYVRDLFESFVSESSFQVENTPERLARTVTIDSLGISGTDFDLSDKDQTGLFNSGYNATKKWLDDWKPK